MLIHEPTYRQGRVLIRQWVRIPVVPLSSGVLNPGCNRELYCADGAQRDAASCPLLAPGALAMTVQKALRTTYASLLCLEAMHHLLHTGQSTAGLEWTGNSYPDCVLETSASNVGVHAIECSYVFG